MTTKTELKAGRELDALVAEKVMGTTCSCPYGNSFYCAVHGTELLGSVKHYSTSIAAAWEVVEKLKSDYDSFSLAWYRNKRVWQVHSNFVIWEADTAPLAICLAALKAVGAME